MTGWIVFLVVFLAATTPLQAVLNWSTLVRLKDHDNQLRELRKRVIPPVASAPSVPVSRTRPTPPMDVVPDLSNDEQRREAVRQTLADWDRRVREEGQQ
jgi:hypothetical protein